MGYESYQDGRTDRTMTNHDDHERQTGIILHVLVVGTSIPTKPSRIATTRRETWRI